MHSALEPLIREAGLKATAGRVAVLEALEHHPHSDAETLYRAIKTTVPSTSIQSVHNIIGDLTAARLVRRIEPAHSAALYERRVDDNHHHLVCTGCGAVADVDCVVGAAPCLTPSHTSGFTITAAEVTFWGVCRDCQASASSPTAA
ncbi:Fur family transcriptional regulator [Humidisolicoccus flavus]|uniref:Fur family transcriptional regulator n=1 Tax=Humidisolicoccus flavus TaxID=3111414 RepID=UPI003245B86E